MLKERPYELNQKLKRVQSSRDNLKANNREKVLQNKSKHGQRVKLVRPFFQKEGKHLGLDVSIKLKKLNQILVELLSMRQWDFE